MTVERRSLADRFWEMVDRRSADECWPWIGPRRRRGYGAINEGGSGGRTLVASRVAWELEHGEPIPEGLIVRHSCDNPPCVNPAHLVLGTHADNSQDRVDRGRHVRGADHPRARLTEQQAIQIVGLLAQHVNQHEIAERFGISQARTGRTSSGHMGWPRNAAGMGMGIMEIKATAFKRGNPPEERNGFYGLEEDLIENAQDAQPIVAIVTYRLDEVVSKAIAGETYPVVETFSIEPLHTDAAIAAAVKLRDTALKARTGIEQLDLPEVEG